MYVDKEFTITICNIPCVNSIAHTDVELYNQERYSKAVLVAKLLISIDDSLQAAVVTV